MYVKAIRKIYFNETAMGLKDMGSKASKSGMEFFCFNGVIYYINNHAGYVETSLRIQDFEG